MDRRPEHRVAKEKRQWSDQKTKKTPTSVPRSQRTPLAKGKGGKQARTTQGQPFAKNNGGCGSDVSEHEKISKDSEASDNEIMVTGAQVVEDAVAKRLEMEAQLELDPNTTTTTTGTKRNADEDDRL